MDSSLLSIRKALFDSYENESFKLKERQRHAMVKRRREEMENDRIFRNKLKEITEKEKEISKRYKHLRKPYVKNKNKTHFAANNISGWQNNYLKTDGYRNDLDLPQETTSTSGKNINLVGRKLSKLKATYVDEITEAFSPINRSSWRSEHTTATLYKKEYHLHLPREQASEIPSVNAKLKNRKVESQRVFTNVHKSLTKQLTPPSPMSSNFANELVNCYKNALDRNSDENAQAFVGKKTGISKMKLGVQRKYTKGRGPLNVTSLDYDIMVIDHGKDDSV